MLVMWVVIGVAIELGLAVIAGLLLRRAGSQFEQVDGRSPALDPVDVAAHRGAKGWPRRFPPGWNGSASWRNAHLPARFRSQDMAEAPSGIRRVIATRDKQQWGG